MARKNFKLTKREKELLKNRESLLLLRKGIVYQQQRNYKEAKNAYLKGLAIKRQLRDKPGTGQFSIADALLDQEAASGKRSPSLQYLEKESDQALAEPGKFLEDLLHENSWLVRREVLETLAEIGNIEPIIRALHHQNIQSRMDAIIVIEKIADKRTSPHLVQILKNGQEHWFIRWRAAKTLGKIQCKEALDLLGKIALYDQHPFVRAGAWQALGMFADKNICHSLVKGLDDPDADVRAAVILVLENRGDKNVIPDLEKTTDGLDSSGQTLKKLAEQAIRCIERRIKI